MTSLIGAGRGVVQAREGFSPHKGAYLSSPHCLDDTETHNPSKLMANTLVVTSVQLGCARRPKQEKVGPQSITLQLR